jgi:hypothetical protein
MLGGKFPHHVAMVQKDINMSLLEFEAVLTSVYSKGGPNTGSANRADLTGTEQSAQAELLDGSAFPDISKQPIS